MIIAVANIKGGVGKTATVLNLAALLPGRVLVVDLDPQGACAVSLGIDADSLPETIYDVLAGTTPAADILITTPHGFDLAPSNVQLAEAELALGARPLREYLFKRAFGAVMQGYDYVLIDTPPTLGLLTINAFAAADTVLIPVSTQLLSLRGLKTLYETILKMLEYGINDQLEIAGILPTKYDSRTIHARQVLEYLAEYADEEAIWIFDPIPATVRFDEATNAHIPLVLLYPDHPASLAYKEVADRVVAQNQT